MKRELLRAGEMFLSRALAVGRFHPSSQLHAKSQTIGRSIEDYLGAARG